VSATLIGGCDNCGAAVSAPLPSGRGATPVVVCPTCRRTWEFAGEAQRLERCCVCGCSRLYRQKAFPRRLGIALVVAGAIASVWTYGLTLVAVFAVDLLIYRFVPEMAVCYLCRAELHGVAVPSRVLPFRHHLAAGYEARRERWLESVDRAATAWSVPETAKTGIP
jgi:hypothetical protein